MGTERIELSPNANREAGQLNTYKEVMLSILVKKYQNNHSFFIQYLMIQVSISKLILTMDY